jgi:predicted hotdog family 3-hydroxylacyl-ACP dehydratase
MVIVNTGLKDYLMIDKIESVSETGLIIRKRFDYRVEEWILLEVFAQTATYHQRYLDNFERHHFLLGVDEFETAIEIPESCKEFIVTAEIITQNESSAVYKFTTNINGKLIVAQLKIASTEKNKDINNNYYKQVFECLLQN